MKSMTQTCDPHRLEAFLHGDLNAAEEDDLAVHLNDCVACRERLEASAAEPACWSQAGELLQPNESGDEYAAARPRQRSLQIQHVLDALAPTDDPEMLGRLGGYEVSGVVGTGGMGVVLKALDKSLDRTVAIKVLAPHLASSGAARKRFAREAKAAAAVLHPNVMAIHSVSNDESLPYLVMPYLWGASLQKRIDDDGPLPVGEILRIGSQIAAGLAAAHAQGLVHRDIKPANILLEEGVERVAITDFGLARAVDDATMTRTGVIAGTPQFMSPEQARGDSVDQRSDLFSLGSVLYAMCTGRPPFRAETSYGILRRITDNEPRPIREVNPDVPEWLCAIIAKLMAKRPEDRCGSAGEVAVLLEDCLAHVQQPSTVPLPPCCRSRSGGFQPPTKTHGEWKPPSRSQLIAAAAFSFALIFAGIMIVLELNKGTLTIECEVGDVPIRITQGDKVVETMTVSKSNTSVRVAAGTYIVEIDGELDGIVVENGTVELRRREQRIVRIVKSPAPENQERKQGIATFHDGERPRIVVTPDQVETPKPGSPNAIDQRQAPQAVTQIGDSVGRLEVQVGPAVPAQVFFQQPRDAKVTTTSNEIESFIVIPGRVAFPTGKTLRFQLSDVSSHPGARFSASLELAPASKLTRPFLEHNAIPLQITKEDVDQAGAGNMVTKVIFLPNEENAEAAVAGVDSLITHRLDAGLNPFTDAQRRGAILAVLRLGNRIESFVQNGLSPLGTAATNGSNRKTVPGTVHSASRKREDRWEVRYPIEPSRFGEVLDFFGVELGVADRGSQEITYLSGLSGASPVIRRGPAVRETRLYLGMADAGAIRIAKSFLEQAGIETRGRLLLWFYPPWAERTLASLEAKAADVQSIDLVDKTVFGVHPRADEFEFYVISQVSNPSATRGDFESPDGAQSRPRRGAPASEPIHKKLAEIRGQAHAAVTSIKTLQYRFEQQDDEGWQAMAEFYGDQRRFRVNRDDVTGIMGLDAELKPKRSEPMKITSAFDGQRQQYRYVIDGNESLRVRAGRAGASYGISTPQLWTYLWLRNGAKDFHWDTILSADLWERRFEDAAYIGDVTEDGRRLEIVDFPQRSGRVACIYRVYFARDLGFLPLKYFRHTMAKNQLSTTMEVTRFKTFTIDGKQIAIPLDIQHRETHADGVSKKGERTMTVDEDSLKVNEPLDESLFTLSRVDEATE